MPLPQVLFDQALQAVRAGQRGRALELLLAYVEQDETNPQVWLWLSELVDDREDTITALENALDLCLPGSELQHEVQARLDELQSPPPIPETPPPPPPPSLPVPTKGSPSRKRGKSHHESERLLSVGKHNDAFILLKKALDEDPQDARAWMLLSEADPDPDGRLRALETVLEIEPGNQEAARRREQIAHLSKDPLQRGLHLEARGELEQAIAVYLSVVTHSRLPLERVEANRRIADLRMRQEVDHIQKVNPTVNLLRLTMGPVVLFILMIFMQSGLNPLHTPLLSFPGMLSVMAGSLLVSATEMRPAHPYWITLFGLPGTGEEPEMRRGLRLLGIALLLAPYALFLLEASHRLGVLQSSVLSR